MAHGFAYAPTLIANVLVLQNSVMDSTATAAELYQARLSLGVSQSKLARLSGVSRFRISAFELGDSKLSTEEHLQIREALEAEARRLVGAASTLVCGVTSNDR